MGPTLPELPSEALRELRSSSTKEVFFWHHLGFRVQGIPTQLLKPHLEGPGT